MMWDHIYLHRPQSTINSDKAGLALLTTLNYPFEEIFISGTLAKAGINIYAEKCDCDAENALFAEKTPIVNIYVARKNFLKAAAILGRIKCVKHFRINWNDDPDIKSPVIRKKKSNKKICLYCFIAWLILFGSAVASILSSVIF